MSIDNLFGLSDEDAVAAKLMDKLPSELHSRIRRAVDIVRGEGGYIVSEDSPGLWAVNNGRGMVYLVDVAAKYCTCPDYETVRMGMCKHRLAVAIQKELDNE